MDIQDVIAFCELILQFQEVERKVLLPHGNRDENDAEHSYMLAMTAWRIASVGRLDLDVNLVVKYALAHDLIEAYAGDTFIYDAELTASKHQREELAAEILQRNYPDFTELHMLIRRYEQRADPEARFVYALDKIIPIIVIYISGGASWKRDQITLKMLRENKEDKIAESPAVVKLWEQLLELLQRQPELFSQTAKTR